MITIILIFLPIFKPGYLGSEAYPSKFFNTNIDNLIKKQTTFDKDDLPYIKLKLNKKNINTININREILKYNDIYVPYSLSEVNNVKFIKIPFVNLEPICLLVKFTDIKTLNNCLQNLSNIMKFERILKIMEPLEIEGSLLMQIFNYGKQYDYFIANYLRLDKSNQKQIQELYSIIFSRGWFFHHYNTISSPIINSNDILQLSNNQYGTGPLIIVKSLNNFGFTITDSIVLGTVLINFLIL